MIHGELSRSRFPRLVIAGLSGDAGKTLVSLGVTLALRARGLDVRGFKKGPDYIDAAWLSWASGRPARNLDSWIAGFDRVAASFLRHAAADGVNLVEGNRGVFDGVDAEGTHSTAALARTLDAPVILVVDARKTTTTAAACVLGAQSFDPSLRVRAVILNRVSGGRHEAVAREAIERRCGIRVLGAIPRLEGDSILPGRHLGLVTPEEHEDACRARQALLSLARQHLDLDGLLSIAAEGGKQLGAGEASTCGGSEEGPSARPTIGYLRDSAFSFYYPDNLEALEAAGASLLPISSLRGGPLPPGLDALYIGGGFPETHAAALSANRTLLDSVGCAARDGLPIYAECGGLMLLASALTWRGERYRMAGVLPIDVEVCDRPAGHGYTALVVDRDNPFFAVGTALKGHEFHYSRVAPSGDAGDHPATACAVTRGVGCGRGRDALLHGNVWASYTHLHALGSPEWATGIVQAAHRHAGDSRRTDERPARLSVGWSR